MSYKDKRKANIKRYFPKPSSASTTTTVGGKGLINKQALGAGVGSSSGCRHRRGPGLSSSLSSYVKYPFSMDKNDKTNMAKATKMKTGVEVDVQLAHTKNSIQNQIYAPLTNYQIKKIKKAVKNDKDSIKIKFSAKQVQKFKQGGLLPAVAAAAAALFATKVASKL